MQPIQIGCRVWRRIGRIEYGFGAFERFAFLLRELRPVDIVLGG
jgi:hypothetical protein